MGWYLYFNLALKCKRKGWGGIGGKKKGLLVTFLNEKSCIIFQTFLHSFHESKVLSPQVPDFR